MALTRWRGNAVGQPRQRCEKGALVRPANIPTPARWNEETRKEKFSHIVFALSL